MNRNPVPHNESIAPLFAALGDSTRLQLVLRLKDGRGRSISRLAQGLKQSRQGVTKHLRVLKEAGLVRSRSIGRVNQFTLDVNAVHDMQSFLESISLEWDKALLRLKELVENEN